MLYPIRTNTNFTNLTSIFHRKENKDRQNNYNDPLNNWWVKSASYTNEIGASIHEIAPRLGQLLWVPTIMYMGADIYDKYKNDKNNFNPSGKRGFEQAIYQGISSFILPAGAILLGQKVTSPVGQLFNKDLLSVNAKEKTLLHMKHAINQCVGDMYEDKEQFKNFMINSLENKINAIHNEKKTDNLFKKILKFNSGDYALANEKRNKIIDFANENIDELFEIQRALKKGVKHKDISAGCYKKYLREVPTLEKMYGKDHANHSIGFVLKHYENRQLFKNKLVRTLGGLIALAVLLKPIDFFVSKILMPKFVDPGIDRFNAAILDRSALKSHIKNNEKKPQKLSFTESANEKKSTPSMETPLKMPVGQEKLQAEK